MFDYEKYRAKLESLADEKYRAFQSKLVPNIGAFLGVRVPDLRAVAREICRGDWRAFLAHPCGELYEDKMVYGMVTARAACDAAEKLDLVRRFVPLIDNWAVCDIVVGELKLFREDPEFARQFVLPYLSSESEFEVRFAVVVLLTACVTPQTIDAVCNDLASVYHDGYYAKMAVAWAVSVCYACDAESTALWLQTESLDAWTHNKALQKICELRGITKDEKLHVRAMRRTE